MYVKSESRQHDARSKKSGQWSPLRARGSVVFLDLGGQVPLSFVHFSLSISKDSPRTPPPNLFSSQGPASSVLPVGRGSPLGQGRLWTSTIDGGCQQPPAPVTLRHPRGLLLWRQVIPNCPAEGLLYLRGENMGPELLRSLRIPRVVCLETLLLELSTEASPCST